MWHSQSTPSDPSHLIQHPRTWGAPHPCSQSALLQLQRGLQRLLGDKGEMALISTQTLCISLYNIALTRYGRQHGPDKCRTHRSDAKLKHTEFCPHRRRKQDIFLTASNRSSSRWRKEHGYVITLTRTDGMCTSVHIASHFLSLSTSNTFSDKAAMKWICRLLNGFIFYSFQDRYIYGICMAE